MKYYDKDIYITSKKLELYITILCTFVVGFVLGYYIFKDGAEKKINSQVIDNKYNITNEKLM